jgi:hypothetical protein
MFDQQRQGLLEMVRQERAATILDVEQMRQATIVDLREERAAVLQAVHDERVAVSATIQDTADTSLRGIDNILRERTAEVPQIGGQLIEHAYRRALQLTIVWGAVALLCCLLWLLSGRPLQPARRGPSEDESSASRVAVPAAKIKPRRVAA